MVMPMVSKGEYIVLLEIFNEIWWTGTACVATRRSTNHIGRKVLLCLFMLT